MDKKIQIPVITEREFEQEVLRCELPVLVDFYADWCAPCKTMDPEILAVATELAGKASFVKVNIDKSQALAQKLRIQSVPTLMVFAGGRVAAAEAGARMRAQIRQMIEPFLPRAEGAIRAPELLQLMKLGRVVPVDIREGPVFTRAHIPGAVSIPQDEIFGRLAELHMLAGEPVLYCRSGDKAKETAGRLADDGTPVPFLEGGLLSWEAERFPIERPE